MNKVNQKNQHLKSIKEFTKKITQEAENFQIPSLAIILSQHFGVNKRTEWVCTLCTEFVGKNKGSLAGHLKKHNKDEHSVVQEEIILCQPVDPCQPVDNGKKTARKNTKKQQTLVIN